MLLPLLAAVWLGRDPAGRLGSQGALGGKGGNGEGQAAPSSGPGWGARPMAGLPAGWLQPPLSWFSSSLVSCPPHPTKGNSGDPPPPIPAKEKTCRRGAVAGKARNTHRETAVSGPCRSAHKILLGGHPRTTWTPSNICYPVPSSMFLSSPVPSVSSKALAFSFQGPSEPPNCCLVF
jgi:hypothetical protein